MKKKSTLQQLYSSDDDDDNNNNNNNNHNNNDTDSLKRNKADPEGLLLSNSDRLASNNMDSQKIEHSAHKSDKYVQLCEAEAKVWMI